MNLEAASRTTSLKDVTTQLLRLRPYPTMGLTVAAVDAAGECDFSHGRKRADLDTEVDSNTRYPFGSFTKVLTAALVCQLAEEGKISLDDPACRYLTGARRSAVTVRQLLSHTSGLIDMFHFAESSDALVDDAFAADPVAPPGQMFSYSNAGYVVLGRIIEEVGDEPWYAQLARRLLDPLEIETVTTPSEQSEAQALGHVYSREEECLVAGPMWPAVGGALDAAGSRLQGSASDAARLAMAIATGKAWPSSAQLLSPGMVREMLTPQAAIPGAGLMASHWCLGWALLSGQQVPAVYGHMGGTSAMVVAVPQVQAAGAVLTNFPFGARLGRDVLAAHLRVRLAELSCSSQSRLPDDASLLAGSYRSSTFAVSVHVDQGKLWMSNPAGGPAVPLVALDGLGGRTFCADLGELVTDVTFIGPRGAPPTGIHLALRLLARSAAATRKSRWRRSGYLSHNSGS